MLSLSDLSSGVNCISDMADCCPVLQKSVLHYGGQSLLNKLWPNGLLMITLLAAHDGGASKLDAFSCSQLVFSFVWCMPYYAQANTKSSWESGWHIQSWWWSIPTLVPLQDCKLSCHHCRWTMHMMPCWFFKPSTMMPLFIAEDDPSQLWNKQLCGRGCSGLLKM